LLIHLKKGNFKGFVEKAGATGEVAA